MKIYNVLITIISLLFIACSDPSDEVPGDEYAAAWDPESTPECEQIEIIDCGGESLSRVIVKDSCITFQYCKIDHLVRVYGPAQTANTIDPDWSRAPEYVEELRALAPHHITFDHCDWNTDNKISLFIGPGVQFLTVSNSTFRGSSPSAVIYLGAESTRITIDNNDFDVDASREIIAVDSSDYFMIKNNRIRGPQGIYTYRNCGQSGVTRQTTPSEGRIKNNIFDKLSMAVFLSSRDWLTRKGFKSYCDDDAGVAIGSSGSDFDWSRRNIIKENKNGYIKEGVSSSGNLIKNNE